jgi:hypothetical protein
MWDSPMWFLMVHKKKGLRGVNYMSCLHSSRYLDGREWCHHTALRELIKRGAFLYQRKRVTYNLP